VGGPILAPSFLGALLLLFTNAFSAYATAAALISQGAPLITLQIANQFQSEVVLGQENVGKAIALGMIIVVSVVMAAYALIQRRASRWVR
jgi:putative spermidine/putrescine transport system permease protein